MSDTMVTAPQIAALAKTEQFLGLNRTWRAVNDEQSYWLHEYWPTRSEVALIKEIESIGSCNADEVNAFLAARGFPDMKVNACEDDGFITASVLDVLVEWLEEGEWTSIVCDGHMYPGVLLDQGVCIRMFNGLRPHPVVSINTKSGDTVYMTMYENPPSGFGLVELALQITNYVNTIGVRVDHYEGVEFPMVDLVMINDISWFVHMNTSTDEGLRYHIARALQQTKLRMNTKGVRVQSSVAFEFECLSASVYRPPYVIDHPFLFWIMRDGLTHPLFVGHITPEHWADPGSLETV